MSEMSKSEMSKPSIWHRQSVIDLYTLFFAAVLFASPWLFTLSRENVRIDLWASSVAIAVIAVAAIIAYANWKEWLNVFLGAWLILSPWILGFTHTSAMHVSITIGAVVAYLALAELILVYPGEEAG
jgi:SPW repeat